MLFGAIDCNSGFAYLVLPKANITSVFASAHLHVWVHSSLPHRDCPVQCYKPLFILQTTSPSLLDVKLDEASVIRVLTEQSLRMCDGKGP